MSHFFRTISLLAICCLLFPSVQAADQETGDRVVQARTFIEQLERGEASQAIKEFDAVMAKALSAERLQALWAGLEQQHGPFQKIHSTRVEIKVPYEIVLVNCQFEKNRVLARVVYAENNQISGLFFKPDGEYQSPGYVDSRKFTEEPLVIGKGLWELPGTLSLPVGEGHFPAVVLVHGSGPQDRNETIGPNQPFKDLAQGLASRGIAVLRYEKRTYHHRLKMALLSQRITVKEETMEDAVLAVQRLAGDRRINAKRIVVLGHSLGGYLLPRIAGESRQVAGLISLAGSVRPLEALILDQTRYLFQQDGMVTGEEQAQLDGLEAQVERVRSTELSESVSVTDLPLGVPASYWLDLRGYQPAQAARTLSQPLLILQGERDYQVTMEDFRLWKERPRGVPGSGACLRKGDTGHCGLGKSAQAVVIARLQGQVPVRLPES